MNEAVGGRGSDYPDFRSPGDAQTHVRDLCSGGLGAEIGGATTIGGIESVNQGWPTGEASS